MITYMLACLGFRCGYGPSVCMAHLQFTTSEVRQQQWPWSWFNPHPSGCIGPHTDDLDPSWTREPPSATPVEVYAGDPFVSHVQANEVFYHWVCHPYCPVLTTTYIIEILIIYAVDVQQCA